MDDARINSGNKMTLRQLPGAVIDVGHCGLIARVLKGHSPKGREICSREGREGEREER